MASGPQHYTKAEQYLSEADELDDARAQASRAEILARAQVDATLALAAATALSQGGQRDSAGDPAMDEDDLTEWRNVAAVQR